MQGFRYLGHVYGKPLERVLAAQGAPQEEFNEIARAALRECDAMNKAAAKARKAS